MAMQLPQFKHDTCKELVICAQLVTDDKALLQWVEDQPFMMGDVKINDKPMVLTLILGGYDPRHVHVELSTPEMFRSKPVKATHKAPKIQQAIEHLFGQKVEASIMGEFWVPTPDLPSFIRSTLVKSSEGDIALKMIGGTVSVQGTPVSRIQWMLKDNVAAVRLFEEKELQINETYLTDSLHELEAVFEALVVRAKPGAKREDHATK